jgi:hypothetical protein
MEEEAANRWDDNPLKATFVRLGLSDLAARKFMENGVTDVQHLSSLDEKALTRFIKIITKDRYGGGGQDSSFPSWHRNIYMPSYSGCNDSSL